MKPLTLSRKRPDGTVEEIEAAKLWAERDEALAEVRRVREFQEKSLGDRYTDALSRAERAEARADGLERSQDDWLVRLDEARARIEELEGALRRLLEHKPEWCGWDDDVRESDARKLVGQGMDEGPPRHDTERKSPNESK